MSLMIFAVISTRPVPGPALDATLHGVLDEGQD